MATIFQRGAVFGPYTIGDLLGSGFVSEVYEARAAGGVVVALKVLKGGAPPFAKREARLGQEGIALADVVHVNVAGFRGEGVVDGRPYLAMERVYGIDLRRLMEEAGGLLPLARAVRIAYQAAEGLAAVHERGILHRDVKPENVLVTPDDLVKLTDFGSAWVGTFGVATTREQNLTSLLYASPEHLNRRPVLPASDVYALGIVVYEMVSGAHPIAPGPASAPEIYHRQLGFDPPPLVTLSSADPPIPRDLSDLVVRMLDKDPANRPASRDLGPAFRAVLRPLLARHRAAAGGAILGRTKPMQAPASGGTIPMAASRAARVSDAAWSRSGEVSSGGESRPRAPDAPGEAVREALPPPAPSGVSRAPATARDPAAATLRSAARAPATMPMSEVGGAVAVGAVLSSPPAPPEERRSTAAPVERPALRASTAPSTRRRAIVGVSVVLGLVAAAAGWFLLGRDEGARATAAPAPAAAPPAPLHEGIASGPRPPAPAISASTSGPAAPAPRPRPAPRRNKIPVP